MKTRQNFSTYWIAILTIVTIVSCTSPLKLYERGQHDDAIELAVKKLQNSNPNPKHITVLENAFNYINSEDLDRLKLMYENKREEDWDRIHDLAVRIKDRQQLVRSTASRLNLKLKLEDMSSIISLAKENAITYWYDKGRTNLEKSKENKHFARLAFNDFQSIKKYTNNYKDIHTLIEEAIAKGKNHTGFTVVNNSFNFLPESIENELYNIALQDIETNFVQFHKTYKVDKSDNYDYIVVARIDQINVSPELVNTNNFQQTRDIVDGFEYKYDNKGKVLKDSTGEPIKFDKVITARANIVEVVQSKDVNVSLNLEIFDSSKRLLKSIPIQSTQSFRNAAATFTGDERAISKEMKCKLGGSPQPFPNDNIMLASAFDDIRNDMKSALRRNRDIVER